MHSDITVAIIISVGAIITGFIKVQGNRQLRVLKTDLDAKDATQVLLLNQVKAQGVYNNTVADTLVRLEQKADALAKVHEDPNSTFATVRTERGLHELQETVNNLRLELRG